MTNNRKKHMINEETTKWKGLFLYFGKNEQKHHHPVVVTNIIWMSDDEMYRNVKEICNIRFS